MIPSEIWTRKYCCSKIPVIKRVYKALFSIDYRLNVLFLSTEIFSKRQNNNNIWYLADNELENIALT